ncbi:MAG: tetratricopeptide (TPR) repeat protein [Myxococcota bacterium]|jgi:tetratricopeptide (TPR) repeat protein
MDLAGPEPEVIAVNAATPGGNKDLAAALANAVAAASADEKRKLDARTADSPKVRRKQSAIRARPATSSESAMALATEAPAVEAAVLAGRLAPVAEGRTAPEEPALLPIFQFRSSLLSRDHFDILGVKPGAPLSTIHMARVALGERFDPTSYMGTYMPPEVRDDLDVINRALDLVAADLADEPRRRWLERQHGQMTDDELARYFRAHERFRAGRDLADQEKHTEAYDCFVEAVALNTLDPFYHLSCGRSQLAFARANKALTGEPLDRAMKHLKDALALDSGFERARVTLAEAYREIGRPQDAMEEYRQIVKNNPRNHDARRALRDLTAAVTQSANPEGVEGLKGKVGGLLGRLRRDK